MRIKAGGLLRAAMIAWLAGCGRARPPAGQEPLALPVAVFADTGRSIALRVTPPPGGPSGGVARDSGAHAAVWLARVSPARIEPAAEPSPEAAPDTLASASLPPPPSLIVDGSLKPPLPRSQTPLAVPPGARGSVELDVRVDEQGGVSEVRWAGGSRDPALVRAATGCARGMRFFPAERAGQPVPVWCRQRFDFGGGEP